MPRNIDPDLRLRWRTVVLVQPLASSDNEYPSISQSTNQSNNIPAAANDQINEDDIDLYGVSESPASHGASQRDNQSSNIQGAQDLTLAVELDIDDEELIQFFDKISSEASTSPEDVPLSAYLADLESDDLETETPSAGETPSKYIDSAARQPRLSSPSSSPSSSSSSSSSPSCLSSSSAEAISHTISTAPIPPLHLALGLQAEKAYASRQDYIRLREIFQLANGQEALPAKLDILRKRVRSHLPMLSLKRKPILVTIQKQPSMPVRDKGLGTIRRNAWLYQYDPIQLVSAILLAKSLTDKIHTSMAHFKDNGTEIQHGDIQGSSIRATSGDTVLVEGQLLIPGNIVELVVPIDLLVIKDITIVRVLFIGRDFTSLVPQGQEGRILFRAQPVLYYKDFFADRLAAFQGIVINEDPLERFIIEDKIFILSIDAIARHVNIFVDREWHTDNSNSDIQISDAENMFIRQVINVEFQHCRPLRQLQPTSDELEVDHYSRQHLIDTFATPRKKVISLPLSLFIDDFGIHRNAYRPLKAFYQTPLSLPFNKRRKLANTFTLSLGPHSASVHDIVRAIAPGCSSLAGGLELSISGEDKDVVIYTFPMIVTGDIPQQADNSGFFRHNAMYGCR